MARNPQSAIRNTGFWHEMALVGRIARGSGTSVEEVNRLLKQFVQMQKMLKQLGGMAGMAGGGRKARRQAMQMLRNRG